MNSNREEDLKRAKVRRALVSACAFLFCASSAFAADASLMERLAGKRLPYPGPNCVDAALIGLGALDALMYVDPTYAQATLLPTCFQATAPGLSGTVAALYRDGSLVHMYYEGARTREAFTKNGLSADEPFQFQEPSLIAARFGVPADAVVHLRYAPGPSCPIGEFNRAVKNDGQRDSISAELKRRAVGQDWTGTYGTDSYQALATRARESSSELVRSLIDSYLGSPMFADAAAGLARDRYVQSLSNESGQPPGRVRARLAELKRIDLLFLEILRSSDLKDGRLEAEAAANRIHLDLQTGSDGRFSLAIGLVCPLDEVLRCQDLRDRVQSEISALAPLERRMGPVILRKRIGGRPMSLKIGDDEYDVDRIFLADH